MSEFGNPSREKVEPLTTQWYEYVDENNRRFEIVRIVDVRSVFDGSKESKILTQARRIEHERFQGFFTTDEDEKQYKSYERYDEAGQTNVYVVTDPASDDVITMSRVFVAGVAGSDHKPPFLEIDFDITRDDVNAEYHDMRQATLELWARGLVWEIGTLAASNNEDFKELAPAALNAIFRQIFADAYRKDTQVIGSVMEPYRMQMMQKTWGLPTSIPRSTSGEHRTVYYMGGEVSANIMDLVAYVRAPSKESIKFFDHKIFGGIDFKQYLARATAQERIIGSENEQ